MDTYELPENWNELSGDDLAELSQSIRQTYGSRTQTIINALLAMDAYLAWYFPFKRRIPFMCAVPVREARALDNMQKAVDMQEIYERLTIGGHSSRTSLTRLSSRSRGTSWRAASASKPLSSRTQRRSALRARTVPGTSS